jgi:hypothetical protein
MGWRRAAICLWNIGKMVANHEKNMHKEATKANWIKVSVAGLGKAFRMAFEEVFVRALDRYHIMQRIYSIIRVWFPC